MFNIEDIDTRHGTHNMPELSHGNCLPLTGLPYAMNYFAVENQPSSWFFDPAMPYLTGIRLTHQASPWMRDFCTLSLLPFSAQPKLKMASYEPQTAAFHPHHLHLQSTAGQWALDLVPTEYGAVLQLTSALATKGFHLTRLVNGAAKQLDAQTISGVSQEADPYHSHPLILYFVLHFSQPVTLVQDGEGYVVTADTTATLKVSLGTSFISTELALRHLPTTSLAESLAAAKRAWQAKLARISVQDHDAGNVATFYHNLWRTSLFPMQCWEEEEGQPIHYDVYADTVRPGYLYMNTGFWDTSRTVFPLLTLIDQPELKKMMAGFLNSYRESGYLPKWLAPEETGGMPGTLFDTVIADLAVKGICLDDMPEFLQAMIHSAEDQSSITNYGRNYIDDYKQYGYVPISDKESVNHTLDYSYSDFSVSQVARVLGDETTAKKYWQRAKSYRRLVDPKRNFVVGRDIDGHFRENFDPLRWGGDYTEGNAWQETYMVYHDIEGLRQSFSSPQAFDQQLTELCNQPAAYQVGSYGFIIHEMREAEALKFGQVNIGNQPSFHLPYLFSFINKSYAMQPMLKRMMLEQFNAGWDAYPGDEDNGSMAAWYVFNSLGLYPFCPGTGEYLLGIPLFDQATIHLSDGPAVTVTAAQNDLHHQFVDHVVFNGAQQKQCFITHQQLASGGTLAFTLGVVPNEACYNADAPFSMTKAETAQQQAGGDSNR
ncbi:GH92 family glycosyl hydrolase [Lacticaseibacillus jixiensis]|uniref:GH92 family glycosyl hydrolase n=1 Tax=Lacticaseibacillus jixiensis TaxID=3231926 RepID=UPI0036F40917